MKKSILALSMFVLTGIVLLISSCSKDDTAPFITLLGVDPVTVTLNSSYSDAGATADDDKDGTVDVTDDVSSTNPDVNVAGTYTIHYQAQDKESNIATETRTVYVVNSQDAMTGAYTVADTCGSQIFAYPQTISTSTTVNNRILFDKFANYINNTGIYANVTGNVIDLPSQTKTGIGGLSESHTFSGTGYKFANGFFLQYTDVNNSQGGASATCNAWFTN